MHNEAQIILQQVFNRRSLAEISMDELQALTDQYPYFNAAQFLLAKKMRMEKHAAEQGKHPAIFFQNPMLFNFLLNQELNESDEIIEEELVLPAQELPTENVVAEETASNSVAVKEEVLEFEPFHTIDYFASQGIRIQAADLSKDKFGQQLKSFTDWLRTMKKIPPSPDQPGDTVAQEQVAQFAQVSNETKEIITETMAQVWTLQGNRQKAIEIYKKLSLQNPAKSAYFATKIEQLNS